MNCAVIIDRPAPEWITCFQSVGLMYHVKELHDINPAMDYPVWVITEHNPDRERCEQIRKFEKQGGALLICATAASKVWNIPCRTFYLKTLLPDGNLLINEALNLNYSTCITSNANSLPDLKGRPSVHLPARDGLKALIIPDFLVAQLLSPHFSHRYFYGEGGMYFPMELVSRVSKGTIRRFIQNSLRYLFHSLNLPFIHLSYLPPSAKALFCFRLDTDYSDEAALIHFYQLLSEYQLKATWFIETKTAQPFLSFFTRLQYQETAYHCYRHRTYNDRRQNENDFQKGLALLQDVGIVPKGYAAPQGIWTPVLADTIAAYGFEYSTEFSLAYDDVPQYPFSKQRFSPTLQIPIHPISAGRLMQARYTDQQITDYYLQWIERHIPRYEPICLYDHPAHRKAECWKPVFQALSGAGILNMTFLDFARWWKHREQVRFHASYTHGVLSVEAHNPNSPTTLAVEYPDHSYYYLPMITARWTNDRLQSYLQTPASQTISISPERLKQTIRKDLRLYYNEWLFRYRRKKQ